MSLLEKFCESKRLGYWSFDKEFGVYTLDLHAFNPICIPLLLKYVFSFEHSFLKALISKKIPLLILCGQGRHSFKPINENNDKNNDEITDVSMPNNHIFYEKTGNHEIQIINKNGKITGKFINQSELSVLPNVIINELSKFCVLLPMSVWLCACVFVCVCVLHGMYGCFK